MIKTIICLHCKEEKEYYSLNMCRKCYKLNYTKNKNKEICEGCGKLKTIHSRKEKFCINCFKKNRKEKCSMCGNIRQIGKRNEDGSSLCPVCYKEFIMEKHQCSVCKEIKQIAVVSKDICYDCYGKIYNQLPETIVRKYKYKKIRQEVYKEGAFSSEDWLDIMNLFDWSCFYCGTKFNNANRSIDHVIPISVGGKHIKENIVPCCRSCNSKKNDRTIFEWLGENVEYYNKILDKLLQYSNYICEKLLLGDIIND